MKDFFVSRIRSFAYAFSGWAYVLRTQRNAWIHAIISILVVILGVLLKINGRDWALIILAMGLVWVAEFINTSIEAIINLASPQIHPLAKIGKDVGAAAVLISALVSIMIGVLVLGPPLLVWISNLN